MKMLMAVDSVQWNMTAMIPNAASQKRVDAYMKELQAASTHLADFGGWQLFHLLPNHTIATASVILALTKPLARDVEVIRLLASRGDINWNIVDSVLYRLSFSRSSPANLFFCTRQSQEIWISSRFSSRTIPLIGT